jgi:hypothetical protein
MVNNRQQTNVTNHQKTWSTKHCQTYADLRMKSPIQIKHRMKSPIQKHRRCDCKNLDVLHGKLTWSKSPRFDMEICM